MIEKCCYTCKHKEGLTPGARPCGTCGPTLANWSETTMAELRTVPDPAIYPATATAPGLKFDGGKAPWRLLMSGCALALAGVVSVLAFGAKKYAADSWQNVENAEDRYRDALYRHLHSIEVNGFDAVDPETGLKEWFHVACNALFLAHFAAKRASK